ncbi:TATA-box-binding protein [Candidatus Undinarchaeota archaeon]
MVTRPKVKVENVVASTSLGVELDLEAISAKLANTEYEPEQFPGLILRLFEEEVGVKAAVLVFRSGKMVCTGTRSPEAIEQAIKAAIVLLETVPKTKIPRKYEITVQNMVASSDLVCELNLDKIAFTLDNAEFEPEQFPGLVYRMFDPKVVFLLFRSGRIICTGAKNIEDVHIAIKKLQKVLKDIKVMNPRKATKDKPAKKGKTSAKGKAPAKKTTKSAKK